MSLKDALLKAGLHSSKIENERQKKLKKEKTKIEKHQEHRNFCEVCETTQPDVERFKHRNPRIDAEWICTNCADKNQILDQFRLTNQSDSARSKRYRRFYGPTKDFSKEAPVESKSFSKPGAKVKTESKKREERKKRYILDEDGEKNFNC